MCFIISCIRFFLFIFMWFAILFTCILTKFNISCVIYSSIFVNIIFFCARFYFFCLSSFRRFKILLKISFWVLSFVLLVLVNRSKDAATTIWTSWTTRVIWTTWTRRICTFWLVSGGFPFPINIYSTFKEFFYNIIKFIYFYI